jgi:hypothetical protein
MIVICKRSGGDRRSGARNSIHSANERSSWNTPARESEAYGTACRDPARAEASCRDLDDAVVDGQGQWDARQRGADASHGDCSGIPSSERATKPIDISTMTITK